MNKRITSLFIGTMALAVFGMMSFAQPTFAEVDIITPGFSKQVNDATGLGDATPIEVTATIVGAFLNILGVLAFVLFVYAGFRWMTAAGREQEVNKAKEMMKQAIIGFVIILAAYSIARYVFTIIEGATGQGAIPQSVHTEKQIRNV